MSTEVISWVDEMAKAASDQALVERPSVSSISLKSGIMTFAGNPVPGNSLDVIVVASGVAHNYYTTLYDPDKISPPECYSFGEAGKELRPPEDLETKVHTDCASCPMNHWGSDPRPGKKGKACRERRILAVIPARAENIERAELATLSLPVTSIKNWSNYVNLVAASVRRPSWGVVTTITVKPHAKNQFEVTFQAKDLVSEDQLPAIHAKIVMAKVAMEPNYEAQAAQGAPTPAVSGKKAKY